MSEQCVGAPSVEQFKQMLERFDCSQPLSYAEKRAEARFTKMRFAMLTSRGLRTPLTSTSAIDLDAIMYLDDMDLEINVTRRMLDDVPGRPGMSRLS